MARKDNTLLKAGLLPAFVLTALVGAMALVAVSISNAVAGDMSKKSTKMDVVDTAVAAGDLTTLVKALEAAGLVETLKGKGPFTVFAPTDEAFAKLPPEKLNSLLKDKAALTKVLTYHVVPGKLMAADVTKPTSAKTLEGQSITVDPSSYGVMVNNAKVVKADIETSNGVIHAIDTVLLPKS
jgi:uncharacterized surface protein with fasciclin (FAS1) repeats